MRSHFLLLNLFLLFCNLCYNQQAPQLVKVIQPAPNVQAMQKYGDIPVSPYTGVPDISIPVYVVKFRDITVPISVSYHASGIKVAEEASQVGLGWTLNAGATISRNIIGGDDWMDPVYFNSYSNSLPDLSDGKGPANFFSQGCVLQCFDRFGSPTVWNLNMDNALNNTPAQDFEPDQYYYNLPGGKSGKFILKRTKEAVLQKQEKILITPGSNGTSFQVKDVDGYVYDFNLYQTTKGAQETQTHISAWYITKITSASGNTVSFQYIQSANTYVRPVGSWSETRDDHAFPSFINTPNGSLSVLQEGVQSGWNQGSDYSTIILDKIDFTNGVVQFNYSNPGERLDVSNDRKLNSISIYTKDDQGIMSAAPIKTISFTYDYFLGGSDKAFGNGIMATGVEALRLKLTQIQETGYFNGQAIQNPPYVFTYYQGGFNDLPAKTSFARDHWGYFNGKTNRASLIPSTIPVNSTDEEIASIGLDGDEREPNSAMTKAFSLQLIKYPTGGSTEFQYETNTFDEQKSEINDHSFFSNQPTIVHQYASVMYDYTVGNHWTGPNTIDMSNEYASQPVHLSVAYRFQDCNQSFPSSITFDIINAAGTHVLTKDIKGFYACSNGNTNSCILCGSGVYTYNTDLNLQPGIYHVDVSFADNSYAGNLQNIIFNFTWCTLAYTTQSDLTVATGGGLRISRIIDHDGINSSNDKVTRFVYHYWTDLNNDGHLKEYSNGRRMSRPHYAYFKKVIELNKTHIGSSTLEAPYFVYHLMRSADSWMPLNGSASGSVVGYDTVTVLYGENGENGKTVYNYHNQPDYVDAYNEYYDHTYPFRPPYSSNRPDPLNGSLMLQTDFKNVNGAFKKVKEISNIYFSSFNSDDFITENIVYGIQSIPIMTNPSECGPSELGGFTCSRASPYFLPCDRYEMAYRTLISDWNYLSGTTVKIFDQNDDSKFAETSINYFYENRSHLMLTKTVTSNSNNEIITTHTSYPLDFTVAGNTNEIAKGIKNLQDNHIINAPIEVYTQKASSNGTNVRTVAGALNVYKTTTPDLDLIYDLETPAPLTTFSALVANQSTVAMNSSYQPLVNLDIYDAFGNILQQHKTDDLKHSYIWDYNNSLPVAEIANAGKPVTAYSSFESNGKGRWSYPGANVADVTSPTGTKCYNLIAGSITTSSSIQLDAGTTYIISYWAKTANHFDVTGTIPNTGIITGKKIGNWTYFEHLITGVTSVTVSFPTSGTGGTRIDELRLYPQTAQMVTYTYEPLIGITSQCDANNKITYYEYDGLGRLKLIRDQDKYILKQFEYKYQLYASSDPIWQATGITRCKPCTQNTNYASNILQQEEKNINSTLNETRWVDIGTSTACGLAAWQNTSTLRCQLVNGYNTGYQEILQTDMNPCSGQGNRWVLGNYNTGTCPNQCAVCSGEDKKCIDGRCQTAQKVYYAKKQQGNVWTYWYHYYWTDCSYSASAYSEDFTQDPNYPIFSGCILN